MLINKIFHERYKIIEHIGGDGALGDTYLAIDLNFPGERKCVVKHLVPQNSAPEAVAIAKRLFQSEAECLSRLGEHECIPRLYSYFEEEGQFYLVEEFIEGNNLDSEFQSGKKWGEEETFNFLQELLEILTVVHQEETIHRDIKPANIMRRERDGKLVLIDFGAVKEILTVDEKVQTNLISLTGGIALNDYLAPEQAMGKPGKYSDIYAVGMLGIQALTGLAAKDLPQDSDKLGQVIEELQIQISPQLESVLSKNISLQPLRQILDELEIQISPHLESVLSKMISLQPQNRFADADEALDALIGTDIVEPLLESFSTDVVEDPTKTSHPSKKLLLALLGAIAIIGTGIYSSRFWNQPNNAQLETSSNAQLETSSNAQLETSSPNKQNKQLQPADAESDRIISEDVNRSSKATIKVLGDTFSGYSTLRSTALQEALKKSGITLQYADEFDQAQRAEALNQGEADLMVTTLDQFLQQKPQGKIVALIDRTVGADAIVLNTMQFPELKSLIDLEKLVKEKQSQGQQLKIVFAGDTPSEFLATVLDTKFDNFDLVDFEVVRVSDASEAWQQMQAPQSNIGLAVLWEPFVTAAKKQGNTVLLSSADAPKVIVDVAVASDSILQSNPQAVQEFVEHYYHRIDSSVQDRAILTRQIATDGNLNDSEAAAVVKGIQFFTSVEAQDWMTSETLDKRIGALAGILALSGRLDEIPSDFKTLYSADFIKSAASKTTKLIEMVSLDNPELAMRLKGTSVEASTSTAQVSETQVKKGADIGNVAVRGQVQFTTGSARLTEEDKRTLDKLAADIAEFNPTTIAIKVQGHTSKTGTANFNQKLSQARASVVVSYLQQKKLPHKFLAEGLGFSQPLPGVDPSSSLNQRTVIRLVRLNSNN